MDIIKKHQHEILLIAIILSVTVVAYFIREKLDILSNVGAFYDYIKGFGTLAPVVSILLIVAAIVLPFLPEEVPTIAAGILLGLYKGFIFSLAAWLLGFSLAFFIARLLGRTVIIDVLRQREKLFEYERMVEKRQTIMWIFYYVPLFPALDVLTYAIGLSPISFRRFFLITLPAAVLKVFIYIFFGEAILGLIAK